MVRGWGRWKGRGRGSARRASGVGGGVRERRRRNGEQRVRIKTSPLNTFPVTPCQVTNLDASLPSLSF
jgi:hypothetical protein